MANVQRGIKRIIWIISISASIAAWIIMLLQTDLSLQKETNQAGIAFINWLDKHYFEDSRRNTLDESNLEISLGKELENIKAKIEKNVKSDSVDRWPFMWELGAGITLEERMRRQILKNRLRDALKLNIYEVKRTFPDIDINRFIQRYSREKANILVQKHAAPENYFEEVYKRTFGRILLVIILGFIPFITIWLIWFLFNWVISGFKN